MKINEVEALVGITKKNIRFYEAEGLLTPRRNSENGYRDYGAAEVEVLRRISSAAQAGTAPGGDPAEQSWHPTGETGCAATW